MSRLLTYLILTLLVFAVSCNQKTPQTETVPPIDDDERLEWWRDAKFGMFIHWGLYALPAGVWEGEEQDGIGEWIMAHADIPVEEGQCLQCRGCHPV